MDDLRRTQLRSLSNFLATSHRALTDVRKREGDVRGTTLHGDKKRIFFALLVAEAHLAQATAIVDQVGSPALDLRRLEDLVASSFTVDERRARRAIEGLVDSPEFAKNVEWLLAPFNFGADGRGEPLGLEIFGDGLDDLSRAEHRDFVFFAAVSYFNERERRRPSSSLRPHWLSVTVLHDMKRALPIWPTIEVDGTGNYCQVSICDLSDTGFRVRVVHQTPTPRPTPSQVTDSLTRHFGLPRGALISHEATLLTEEEQVEAAKSHVVKGSVNGFSFEVSFFRLELEVASGPREAVPDHVPPLDVLKQRSASLLRANPGLRDGSIVTGQTCPACATENIELRCVEGKYLCCYACYWKLPRLA